MEFPSLLARIRVVVSPADTTAAESPSGRRRASVLLLFDAASPRLPLLFTLRSPNLRQHPGQIGFPGGTEEPGDATAIDTALREAHEEVGLSPDNVEVLGVLSPLVTAMSERWLTPVVGVQRQTWEVRADPVEVAETFRIDLADLIAAPHTVRDLGPADSPHPVHFYDVAGRVIWGVSAAILHELLERIG